MANSEDRRVRKDRYEDTVRISLLEDDMNHMETKQNAIHDDVKRSNKNTMFVILALFTTTAGFAANLVFNLLKGIGGG